MKYVVLKISLLKPKAQFAGLVVSALSTFQAGAR
jgi:hypothetical protein